MKKIFLLLIGLISFSVASDQYEFVVENSSMVDAYFNIFNAIGAMLQNDSYLDLLRLTFLVGGFFVFTMAVFKAFQGEASGVSTVGPYAKYLVLVTAMLTFVFSHKSELWVTTNNLPSYCSPQATTGFAVSMPTTLAYVFSFTHKIGEDLTTMMDSAFSQPTSTGTTSMKDSNGYLGGLKSAIQLLTVNPSRVTGTDVAGEQVNFTGTLQNHLTDCVYGVAQNKGALGNKKIEEFLTSKDIAGWLQSFLEYKFSDTEQKTGEYLTSVSGETLTCRQNFVYVKQALDKYKSEIACALPAINGTAMKLLTGDSMVSVSKMQEISLQAGLINSLEDTGNLNSIGISGADFSAGKTKVEFTQTQLASGQYLAEMLPMIQMVIRALLYALFPLIFVVMLLPGGMNVMKQYAQTLLWVELWMPTAAIINMFINMNAESKMSEVYEKSGLTLLTSIQMLEDSATIAGYGAYLYASVPALTWLILKGSGSMLGNITSGISAGFAGNMSSEKQAEDLSKLKASKEADKTITQLESLHYANKASQSYGEAVGYDKSGGMKQNMKVADISKQESTQAKLMSVLQAGGEASYLENQKQTAGYATEKAVTENKVTTANGGDSAVRNVTEQSTGTAQVSANLKKSYAGGSNGKVVETEAKKNVNDLANTLGKLENGSTTTTSYNVGAKAGAEEKGTSNVVDKKGTGGITDKTEQDLMASIDTAEALKKDLGNNQNVANTSVYKNRVDALQADKTSKVLSADENADLGAKADQKQKFQIKGESAVLGNDMNKVNQDSGMKGAMENKAELLKVDTDGKGTFSKEEMDNFQKIANTSAISDHASKEAKQKMLEQNGDYFSKQTGRVKDIYEANLNKYGSKTAAAAATMEAIEKDVKSYNTTVDNAKVNKLKENPTEGAGQGLNEGLTQVQKNAKDNRTFNDTSIKALQTQLEDKDAVNKMIENKANEKGITEDEALIETAKDLVKGGFANEKITKAAETTMIVKNDLSRKETIANLTDYEKSRDAQISSLEKNIETSKAKVSSFLTSDSMKKFHEKAIKENEGKLSALKTEKANDIPLEEKIAKTNKGFDKELAKDLNSLIAVGAKTRTVNEKGEIVETYADFNKDFNKLTPEQKADYAARATGYLAGGNVSTGNFAGGETKYGVDALGNMTTYSNRNETGKAYVNNAQEDLLYKPNDIGQYFNGENLSETGATAKAYLDGISHVNQGVKVPASTYDGWKKSSETLKEVANSKVAKESISIAKAVVNKVF